MDEAIFGQPGAFLADLKQALRTDAAAQAEYARLDDLKKTVLAQIVNGLEGSFAQRESLALSNERYVAFLGELAAARRAAKEAAAEVKYLEVRFEMWRTREASHRAKQGGR